MENTAKRIKIEENCVSLDHLPVNILNKILSYLSICDQRSLTLVNHYFNLKMSQLLKDHTYFYISKVSNYSLKLPEKCLIMLEFIIL